MDRPDLHGVGAGSDGFRLVIPTRDSARWIAALASEYDRVGVRPLFIVDSRSVDGTSAALRAVGADLVEVLPADDCVEDIVWRIPTLTDASWLLRFDDDEMPSAALLQWVRIHLQQLTLPTVAFPRRWALRTSNGSLWYAQHKQLYYIESQPDLLDPQIRLYRPDQVKYFRRIHSPGFTIECGMHIAPPEAFICHFDWIARSFDERHAKLMRYEAALPGSGSKLLYFYLPELLHPSDRCDEPFETTEFDALAALFARRRRPAPQRTIVSL